MQEESKFVGAFRRMLLCQMPDAMRRSVEEMIQRENVSEYEYKSAYANYARRLVLAKPREQIDWNPTVQAEMCTGCETCFDYCPHDVYEIKEGRAVVVRPTQCVILCHNCEALCPTNAIRFPPQRDYIALLHYQ